VRWCGNEAGRTRDSEWSVIPIGGSPDKWDWPDMMDEDLGSLNKLKTMLDKGGFLHWYPAETNTSIRKGWFWRDEFQYVKSTEEILDIWYRSVGGNSVFLLNIPPNRDGLFSDRDVKVLSSVGRILSNTFKVNLACGGKAEASSQHGPKYSSENILDDNTSTCWMPPPWTMQAEVKIILPEKCRFNRIMIQEHIADFSQRISRFAIDAFINDDWRQIAQGTTIGYKRICQTVTVSTDRVRIRILDSRVCPTISNFGLFYEEVSMDPLIIEPLNELGNNKRQ
jgi:alpha-L-fucosidase